MGFKHEFERVAKALNVPMMLYYENPAAKAVGVHAAVAANAASNTFPGPITDPAIPRSLQFVFAAGWDGGDIYVDGLDQFGRKQSETIADVAGSTVEGVKIWSDVTNIRKQTVGATANTVTVQTGPKLGILFKLKNAVAVLLKGATPEAVTMDATYHAFTPTTAPDGANDYTLFVCGSQIEG